MFVGALLEARSDSVAAADDVNDLVSSEAEAGAVVDGSLTGVESAGAIAWEGPSFSAFAPPACSSSPSFETRDSIRG